MPRKHHTLKTETAYYQAVEAGIKTFELCKNDREFRVGDMVTLVEVVNGIPTGRELDPVEICYVIWGDGMEEFGLMRGYCIFSWKEQQLPDVLITTREWEGSTTGQKLYPYPNFNTSVDSLRSANRRGEFI